MDIGQTLMYVVIYFGLFTSLFFFLTLYEHKKQIRSPSPKRFPRITIMVPAFNEEKTIEKTLDSLLALRYPKELVQIIVIDDGSTDETLRIAKRYASSGVLVLHKRNGGKGVALNYALRKATGELVCALDADSFVDKHALKRIVGYFEDPQVMAVTPSLKVNAPQNMLQKIQYMEYLLGIYLRKIFAFLSAIHVTPGPFSLYRKEFFKRYGNYDHTTITEDIEIALRIQALDFKIENSVDAFVYTNTPSDFSKLLRQRIRWYRGFLDNVIRYKRLFSLRYGDLGVFILPASFVSIGLVVLVLFYSLFKILENTYKQLINLINIDFDLFKLFEFRLDWFFFDQSSIMLLTLVTLCIGITMILLAKKLAQERVPLLFMYLTYMVVYMPLFALWWLCAAYYRLAGKKIRWAGKMM